MTAHFRSTPAPLDNGTCCRLIEQLVAIPSVSGDESAAVKFLVRQFESLGYARSFVDSAGNAVGIRGSAAADSMTVILLGHIDTVPGDIPVEIRDGVLHGRGSVDAKGPLATFALAGAMAALHESIRLVVVGAVEEESASSRGARQIAEDYKADMCIIGEPSGTSGITLGYKGRILIDYEIEASEGHTAGPGRNAAEQAAEFWQLLLQHANAFNQNHDKLFDQLLPSLRGINSSSDGLTSRATARVGVRLPPDLDIEDYQRLIREWACDGTVNIFGYEAAWRCERNNALVRALASSIREAGLSVSYKLKTGTCDMNVVGPVWQCPIVAYGPGDSALDHTPEEHLVLDEFLKAVRVLRACLERLHK